MTDPTMSVPSTATARASGSFASSVLRPSESSVWVGSASESVQSESTDSTSEGRAVRIVEVIETDYESRGELPHGPRAEGHLPGGRGHPTHRGQEARVRCYDQSAYPSHARAS